jgi:hypothetical protein
MIDWKEFFPVQALAPFIGGLLLWFGLSYIYFAPSVIAPRLADRYYLPACLSAVAAMEGGFQQRIKTMDEAFREKIKASRADLARRMNEATGVGLGMLLGDSAEGRRLSKELAPMLGNSASSYVQMGIEQEVAKAQNAYEAEKQRTKNELQSKQKFSDARSYCSCSTAEGLSNRIETALFVSTLRIYKPDTITRLEAGGATGENCGTPPVVR